MVASFPRPVHHSENTMAKRRNTVKIDLGTIEDGGTNASPSFDLSSCTSAYFYATTSTSVNYIAEISPDPFSTSDADATWFSYGGMAGTAGESSLPNDGAELTSGNNAIVFPPCSSAYGSGNVSSISTRRMRVKNLDSDGGGDITGACIVGHRRVG